MAEMDLKYVSVRRLGEVAVLRPHQSLLGGEESEEFRGIVKGLDGERLRCLVINLRDVDLLNSLGLGTLVDAHQRFAERGGRVCLVAANKRVQDLFALIRLGVVIDCFPTEEAAIEGCTGKGADATRTAFGHP